MLWASSGIHSGCLSCEGGADAGWWPFSRIKAALNWRTVPARPLEIPEILEHDAQLGHIRVSNVEYWAQQQKRWISPGLKKRFMLDTFTAPIQNKLSALGADEEDKPLRWDRPMGCVFYAPSVWSLGLRGMQSWPLACSFEHDKGNDALLKSLAKIGASTDSKNHEGRLSLAGAEVFVDSIGKTSVLSVGDDSFAQSKNYLRRNVLDTSNDEGARMEAVLFVGKSYRKLGAWVARGLSSVGDLTLPSHPMSKHASQMGQQGLKTGMTMMDDLAQLRLGAKVVDERSVLFGDFRVAPESTAFAKLFQSEKKEVIDPRFLARLPDGAFAVAAAAFDQGDHGASAIQDILVDLLLVGEEAAHQRESREVLQKALNPHDDANGQWAWAMVPLEASSPADEKGQRAPFGAALVQLHKVSNAKKARKQWRAQLQSLAAVDSEGNQGGDQTRRISFRFEAAYRKIQGVELDRLTPIFVGADSEGGWNIQMGYEDDIAFTVISSNAQYAPVSAAVSALQGTSSLGEHWVFRSVASRFSGNHFGAALDLKRVRQWVLSLNSKAGANTQVAQWDEMGKDLSDLWYVHRVDPKKGAAFEMSASDAIAHQLITQVQ